MQSFCNINQQYKDFYNYNVHKILVGNKNDMKDNRVVSYDEGKNLANSLNIEFFETSAKDDININNIFNTL